MDVRAKAVERVLEASHVGNWPRLIVSGHATLAMRFAVDLARFRAFMHVRHIREPFGVT